MKFASPLFLLLCLGLPMLAWIGWPTRGLAHKRQTASLVLRLTMALCVILALAGMEIVRGGNELALVFLVDVSDSMPRQAVSGEIDYVRRALAGMGPDDQAAVVLFGGDALVERPMLASRELGQVTSVPVTTQTDLSRAIQLGMALYPSGPARRMVILSDGIQTSGNAEAAAQFAAASGVQIFAVPFVTQPGPEALVRAVHVPAHLRPGETFDLTVSVQASGPMPAELRVLAGDRIVVHQSRQLRRGDQTFSIPLTAGDPGFIDYQVQIAAAQDTYSQNNRLDAFSQVDGPPRILMVASHADGAPDESSSLRGALEAAGFQVQSSPPTLVPSHLPGLAAYNSVVLVDVPASDLGENQMTALQSYVRDLGGGLVAVGGPHSYGVGGYYDTPLEQTLPVDMQIKDETRRPSLGMVFIIDHSGSMSETSGGDAKLELAKEAAARSVRMLFPTDRVGVLAFDDTASWVVPVTPLSDVDAVRRAIGSIQVGGGTDILGAVQAMAKVLPGDMAKVKHVVLLTDGGADPTGIPELVQQLYTEDGITFSTVGVGQDAAPFLRDLAKLGGGRYHFTSNAASIPAIFTEETTLAMRAYLVEESFTPRLVNGSPILSGIDGVPPLYGYVATSPKPLAQVILESDQHDPILATWQYGLGHSVGFTSDATGHWGIDWVRWKAFPAFWAQAIRYSMANVGDVSLSLAVQHGPGQARLTLDALGPGGDFLNGYQVQASIVSPAGETQAVTLQQVAPGRYEAAFVPKDQGVYVMHLTGSGSGGEGFAETVGWAMSYSPEFGEIQPNPDLLVRLATLTGGRISPTNPVAAFDRSLSGSQSTRPLAPWLIVLAAIILPFDVATRRLVLTRLDMLRFRDKLAARVPVGSTRAQADSSPHMEALLRTKKRVSRTAPVLVQDGQRQAGSGEARAQARDLPEHSDEGAPQSAAALAQVLLAHKKQRKSKE